MALRRVLTSPRRRYSVASSVVSHNWLFLGIANVGRGTAAAGSRAGAAGGDVTAKSAVPLAAASRST